MSSDVTALISRIQAMHAWFCEATDQKLSMRFDRERQWQELFRAGFSEEDVRRVVWYLRREIAESRRNPGALKLSNLLQLDRFEEDLNLSRVKFGPDKKALPPLPGANGGQRTERTERTEGTKAAAGGNEAGRRAFEQFRREKQRLFPGGGGDGGGDGNGRNGT